MRPTDIDHMFGNLKFTVTTDELKTQATAKAKAIRAKIAERVARVAKLRADYKITDAVLLEIMQQARAAESRGQQRMSYSYHVDEEESEAPKEMTVGAGVITGMLEEQDLIASEEKQAVKLETIARRLRPTYVRLTDGHFMTTDPLGTEKVEEVHTLSFAELTYLGF